MAGQSDVVSSVLMGPFLMLLLLDAGVDLSRAGNVPFLYRLLTVRPALPLVSWQI